MQPIQAVASLISSQIHVVYGRCLNLESGQPFIKDHTDQRLISTEKFDLIAASRRGRSHEHAGTFRDDDFSLFIFQIQNGQ